MTEDKGWKNISSWEDIPVYEAYEVEPVQVDSPINITVDEDFLHEVRDFTFRSTIEYCILTLEAIQGPPEIVIEQFQGAFLMGRRSGLDKAIASFKALL